MKQNILIGMIVLVMLIGAVFVVGPGESQETELEDSGPVLLQSDRPVRNKTFYMYSTERAVSIGNKTTKQIFNTTSPMDVAGNGIHESKFKVVAQWYLFPRLAGDVTLDGDMNVTMWARKTFGTPENAGIKLGLYEVTPDGDEFQIVSHDTGDIAGIFPDTNWRELYLNVNVDNYIVSEGSTIKITYELSGNANSFYSIAWGNTTYDSRLSLPAKDYIQVENVYTVNHEGNITATFFPDATNTTMYIRANVTDPFGGYDIEWVNLTLRRPDGSIVPGFDNVSMNKTYGFYNSYRSLFELKWNYTGQPEGTYNVTVRAVDKNGMRAWYDSGGAHFGEHDVYGFHEFHIGGLDHFINFKLLDKNNKTLPNATLVVRYSGALFARAPANESGMVNITMANLTYDLSVIWQDVEVGATPSSVDVGVVGNRPYNDPLNITAAVYYPNIYIRDSKGALVYNARVYVTHPNGTTLLPPKDTGSSGMISLPQTPEGVYSLRVIWSGRDVGTREVTVDSSGEYSIYVDIFYLWVNVKDYDGEPVTNALVVFEYVDSALVADSRLTLQNGSAMARLPGAEYRITVYWRDARVYDGTHLLDESKTISITADIYTVTVEVTDWEDEPLSGAVVSSTYTSTGKKMGEDVTDSHGNITVKLTEGDYTFTVRYMGVQVAEETETISATNTVVTIRASVYHLRIKAVDNTSDLGALVNASVSIKIGDDVVDTGTTGSDGIYISQLPATNVGIRISWLDIGVYDDEYTVTASEEHSAVCDVYYLDISTVDSRSEPVEGVSVSVRYGERIMMSTITDQNGDARVRLPVETYTIDAYWNGVHVASTEHTMTAERDANQIVIVCDIFYVTVDVSDTMGDPVSRATVSFILQDETVYQRSTDEHGNVSVRLPKGDYTLIVTWNGFEVAQDTETIDEDADISITASIYHVTFVALDSQNNTIDNADLTLYVDSIYASLRTDSSGESFIILPGADFTVGVEWKGITVHGSDITVSENGYIYLDCEVYYLTLSGIDADGMPVEGVDVALYHTALDGEQYIDSVRIYEEGIVRVPVGNMNVIATWKGFTVAVEQIDVDSDMSYVIDCQIYYAEINALDSEGNVLDGAVLVIEDEDGNVFVTTITENGVAVPRLPTSEWNVNVYWWGKHVGQASTGELNENTALDITTTVHYIRVTVSGAKEGIAGVELTLSDLDGKPVMSVRTDSDGKAVFPQVVEGEYILTASLKKTTLMTRVDSTEEDPVNLDGSQDISIKFEEYPPATHTTNLFFTALAFVAVIVLGSVMVAHKKEVF